VKTSTVHGLLGVEMTWGGLTAKAALPAGWRHAEARLLFKGQPWRVVATEGRVRIERDEPRRN
jgi:hypothetical protein